MTTTFMVVTGVSWLSTRHAPRQFHRTCMSFTAIRQRPTPAEAFSGLEVISRFREGPPAEPWPPYIKVFQNLTGMGRIRPLPL